MQSYTLNKVEAQPTPLASTLPSQLLNEFTIKQPNPDKSSSLVLGASSPKTRCKSGRLGKYQHKRGNTANVSPIGILQSLKERTQNPNQRS